MEKIKNMLLTDTDQLIELIRSIIQSENQILVDKLVKPKEVVTRKEGAEILKVCENTISRLVQRKQLNNLGMGRKILLDKSELLSVKKREYNKYKMI